MDIKTFGVSLALIAFLAAGNSQAESDIALKFGNALNTKDSAKMNSIIKENRDKIPSEINALIEEALQKDVTPEEREAKFYVAEFMATEYKDVTGDTGPLRVMKKKVFESRLSKPVRSTPSNGVHLVKGLSSEKVKNIFSPDNIVIKKGETVMWVNNDNVPHLLASVPVIGMQGIFSPNIDPGQSWKFTFDKPGEYYYVCFIHKVMYGKITVE